MSDVNRRIHELILKQRSIIAKMKSGQIYDAELIEVLEEPKAIDTDVNTDGFFGQGE